MQKTDIEDVYQLSPLQQGMLFHHVEHPEADVYVVQFCLTLSGPLSPQALEQAWDRVLAQHPVLRSSFHWEKLQAPSQVVHRRVKLPIEIQDWRGRPADLSRFLAEDRARGFDLTKAPLMRLSVLRTGPEEHLLVWTHHHLLLDGWSVAVVVGQVLTLYEALVRGESRELERSRPFREYIAWLRRQDLGEAERFWRQELAGFTEPTPLGSREPLAGRSGFGDRTVRLSPTATAALQALGREHQLTVNTLAQGAWALLLSRYGGTDDVLFGVTVSGRPASLPGVESMVGLFINTLPLRVGIEADAPLLGWLRRLQERQAVLRQYEHSPLFEVQSWSDLARGTPLFHSLFVFENFPTAAERRAGPTSVEIRELHLVETSNYPLTLAVTPGVELALRMIWDRGRFEETEILRLQEHLRMLLEGITATPHRRLSEIEMLTVAERHQSLVEWNDTAIELPGLGVHQLFEEWVERTPDAPALTYGDRTLTYAELNRLADLRAAELREQGPGSIIPLTAERSPDLILGMLAILKAGGAYLPLDPALPEERRNWVLEDAGARPTAGLAYVMYTSGSTGRPKGVEVGHASIVRLVRPGGSGPFEVGPGETWLQLAPAAFDASTLEIWGALANGGHLVLLQEGTPSLDGIAAAVRRHGVTSLWLTSGLFHQMVAERGLGDLTTLRQLLTGGDVLSAPHSEEALRQLPGLRLIAAYGPTENTVFTSCHPITRPLGASVPIGRPIPGTRIHLLDAHLQPVPMGAPGRLFTGGHGLARGYLRRPDLTAERFVPDPFADLWNEPGARLYDTGDLARRRPDGVLEFLGRTDTQVKIRGHRVEPGEVEAVLREHPDVADAVVLARPDAAGQRRLVAWVVPPPTSPLRPWLEQRLPEPLIPAAFVGLDAFPLTPNGKVDRRALPDPEEPRHEAGFTGPRTPAEEVLEGIWGEVLGLERIGIEEDFFERGGHSLSAIQVVSRVRKTFGVELPLRALFEEPTIAALARQIETLRRTQGALAEPPLVPLPRTGGFPLSFAQQRLWFLDQLEPGRPTYNIPFALRLQGDLDAGALERALAALVERHDSLRTTFPAPDGEPVQRIARAAAARALLRLDLQGVPEDQHEAEVRRLAQEESLAPFDLARGPLLRSRLLRLGADDHLLLLTIHHIVSDGWSMGVLVRDVIELYRSCRDGVPAALSALPIQYADYTVWQREQLQGEALQTRLGWWRERLAGAPSLLDLPTDRPLPPVRSARGASASFELPPDLSARIRLFGRRQGATLHMTWLAALAALLQRYGCGADLPLGTTVANRDRRELEDLIGFFVNALALRVDASGDPAGSELVKRTRETALAAYAWQDLPFEKLVAEIQPERNLASTPIFQTLLVVQNAPAPPIEMPGLVVSPLRQPARTSRFDLSVNVFDTEPSLTGNVTYATDLFDAATAHRMLGHLSVLLGAMIEAPTLRLSELPLVTEAELAQILTEWSGTALAPPAGLVHELLGQQVERTPDDPAVRFREEVLTFRELADRAGLLARWLRRHGVGPEVPVAFCLERSTDLLVAVFGILQAGGAFVPLDPAAPPRRQELVLEDCGAPVLLTHESLLPRLSTTWQERAVCLDRDREAIAAIGRDESGPLPRVEPSNLCYVIYTSGSTGRPKGVLIQHASVVHLARGLRQTVAAGLPTGLVCSVSAPLAFDASIQQLTRILSGDCLDILPDDVRLDPEALPPYLESHLIDVLDCTPAQLRLMLGGEAWWKGHILPFSVLVGGEALDEATWETLAADSRITVLNMYGPTECTVDTVIGLVEPGPATIGRPVPGAAVYILDPDLRPVPAGVAGQLHITGAGLGRGYLGRPDMTAAAFRPDPLAARRGEPGARLYATGDLARWLPDGRIDFRGRLDHQVKIRGLRIEIGEIEAVLSTHPDIQEAAVLVREERPGDRQLVAWIVLHPKSNIQNPKTDLRAWLADHLPGPMIPSAFVVLNALPLTAQGKVDRRALPAPETGHEEHAAAPRTPTEEVLAGIWEEVLGRERIGVDADFFDLGGHSLLAIQVVSRVRRSFGVELPLRALFEDPTVAMLAGRIEELQRMRAEPSEAPLVPVPRDGDLPLSFPQQRLWFLDRLEPGRPTYNIPIALWLHGDLEPGALESALAALVERHESLRTTFPAPDGEPVQRIARRRDAGLSRIDLPDLPEFRREAEALRLAEEEALAPFDLARGPLLRSRLVRFDAGHHLLLLTLHHIVSDGWSMGVLVRDMIELIRSPGSPRLPELPIQYGDYAVWQRSQLQGATLQTRLAEWRDRLAGAPALLDLPTDRPRPPVRSARGAGAPFDLPPALSAQIRALGRHHGATLHMTWLAALAALLQRYGCGTDLPVGTTVANRERRELEDLIGFFVNTLVLRVNAVGDPTVSELLRRARETALAAYAGQDLPFEKLVEELQPERDLSHTPLFQVLLAVQNAPAPPVELPGLTVSPLRQPARTARFDLSLTVLDTEPGLAGNLTWATDLFDAATAHRMLEHLSVLLAAMAESPALRLSELPLLTGTELTQILTEWSGSNGTQIPSGVCVHDLFTRQAESTPDAPAVRFREDVLTFRELETQADLLAHDLARLGVAPEIPIPLFLERSTALLVAVLGILKAGGAFVPIDPATPSRRLELILEDCGTPLVVTQESLLSRLPAGWKGQTVCLQRDREALAQPAKRPLPRVLPSNLCYVIYTSGSTGRPKGVLVQHASAVNLALALRQTIYAGQPSGLRVAVNAPLAFDGSIKQVLQVLFGDCLDFLPEDLRLDPGALPAYLKEHAVDVLDCTPSQLRLFLDETSTHVPTVLVGGEALDEATWARLATDRETVFWNVYGPTECTVDTTVCRISPSALSIGRPIPNAVVHLLDPDLQPVPAGVVGQLHVAGAGLARGYLARPDLTAEKFLPNPFGDEGARLYATGDLARWLPDGRIEIRGRADHQVKVRGFRIELGEIEAVLASHPEIREAAVLATQDTVGDHQLVAWIVPAPESGIQHPKSDLRGWLRERLPAPMIPSDFIPVPDLLPRTTSGKVDRQALLRLAPQGRDTQETFVAPRDPVEEKLATLWMELLRVERVGVHDNFFDLGGHSLLVTRLAARIRRDFGVDLSLHTLFEAADLAAQAKALLAQLMTESGEDPDSLLAELDGMSEEEVQALLGEE
jgi:amino acid adenylation domain-containing protein